MTQLGVGLPWAWTQPWLRDETSFPKGIWPHHGGVPLVQAQCPPGKAGIQKVAPRWHLCDPKGPWQGEKPAEDRQFLREGGFGVFPLHFLAQEGRAHCWQSLFPHLSTSKLPHSLCLLNFQKEEEKIRISKLRSSWSCTLP